MCSFYNLLICQFDGRQVWSMCEVHHTENCNAGGGGSFQTKQDPAMSGIVYLYFA